MNKEHIVAQILLRSWPFPRGAGRLLDTFFSKTQFPEEISEVKTTDGFQISVMPNDLIGRHIYLTGEFDRSTVEILCNFSEAGDTLLDIGANIGYVSACFLQNVLGSTVIAVEPQPLIVDLLKTNLTQFGSRQRIFSFALSDRDGEAWFKIDKINRGASGLVSEQSANSIKVEIKSADAFFSLNSIDKIDVVKIDVEGHEEEILNVCKDRLVQLQPRAIMFEEHSNKCAPENAIGSIIKSMNYSLFGIHKKLHRLVLQPIEKPSDCTCNDYVAVSKTRQIPKAAFTAYWV